MKWIKTRNNQIMLIVVVCMALMFGRLIVLTVIQHDQWTAAADDNDMRSIYTVAPRGEIYDRYGRLLAGNLPRFVVQFSRGRMGSEELNRSARTIIEILEKNGEDYIDNFPILCEDGRFEYRYRRETEAWLRAQGMPASFTAEQAFDEIRRRNNIGEDVDRYTAQGELLDMGVSVPISVRRMAYSRDLEKFAFLSRYGLDKDCSAEDAFFAIAERFGIDENLSPVEMRKVMTLRNELSVLGYMQYVPATIATNISDRSVIQIEERSDELRGISVVTESVRFYPYGSAASHILGYMGHISEDQKDYYVNELGYRPTDMVGLDGVERSLDADYLKGTDGIREVQVNSRGELIRVIGENVAEKGKDVYLTIDIEYQKTVEAILERGLAQLQKGGVFESKWGDYHYREAQPNANVGAVVVLDVKTGEPLAIANAPNFDPNIFSDGISSEDWNALQSQNPRDLLSPLPLYNVAARTAVQPGSTFKMITAIAALEAGLNPRSKLYDGGVVKIGVQPYRCLLYTTSGGSHGSIDLYQALEVSCNYYFYDIATGMDYHKNHPLPFKDDISIEKVTYYADQFGLGRKTGIELSETALGVPTAEKKLATTKALLERHLRDNAEEYFEATVTADKNLLVQRIEDIVSWTEENPAHAEIRRRLEGLGIREDVVTDVADMCKYTYYNYAKWTVGDELNISIGQGNNAYTPIQMANYIATLGNGGVRNTVSLVKAVEGVGEVERARGVKVDISDDAYIEDVLAGMKRVTAGASGSLRSAFAGLPIRVAAKTGTAQKSGKIQPPDEVAYIRENLSRIDARLNWEDVEAETERLTEEYPNIYTSQNRAVRKAVTKLSEYRDIEARMDRYKDSYKPFAWVVALAPADDPQIAVAVLIFQGNSSLNAAPVAKEVIGAYFEREKDYRDFNPGTKIN